MSIETFTERRTRIVNQTGSLKSDFVAESGGTAVLPRLQARRTKAKPIWKWPVLILFALLSTKVVLWHKMGEDNYYELVHILNHGNSTQAVAALVMTPDPATAFVVSALGLGQSPDDSPRILAIGEVRAGVSYVEVSR